MSARSGGWTTSAQKLTPREAQDLFDDLTALAKTNPFWADLKGMGVKDHEASVVVTSMIKVDGAERQTSVAQDKGADWLKKELAAVGPLSNTVDALLSGASIDDAVKGLPEVRAKAILGAKNSGPAAVLALAVKQLEWQLGQAFTDSATDLLNHPKELCQGFDAALRGRTEWLKTKGSERLAVKQFILNGDFGDAFVQLRQLVVLDPAKAHKLGRLFVDQLRQAAVGTDTDFAPK